MRFWKTLLAIYQVIIAVFSLVPILLTVYVCFGPSLNVYYNQLNLILLFLLLVPTVIFCFCNAIKVLLSTRNIFAKWKSLAQTSVVFTVLWTLLFAYVLIFGVGRETGIGYTQPSQTLLAFRDVSSFSSLEPEQIAPDFSGKDQFGKTISLSELKGKIILLNFWATWCGPCMHELPYIQKIWERHHNNGLTVIGINLDYDSEKFRKFSEKQRFSYSQIHDKDREIEKSYGVNAIPAVFLIDEQGKIVGTDVGDSLLIQYVGQLMNAYRAAKSNDTTQLNEQNPLRAE